MILKYIHIIFRGIGSLEDASPLDVSSRVSPLCYYDYKRSSYHISSGVKCTSLHTYHVMLFSLEQTSTCLMLYQRLQLRPNILMEQTLILIKKTVLSIKCLKQSNTILFYYKIVYFKQWCYLEQKENILL